MNYVKNCLIITMLVGAGNLYAWCDDQGDMNTDGSYNVIDIVALANCVLALDCEEYCYTEGSIPNIIVAQVTSIMMISTIF